MKDYSEYLNKPGMLEYIEKEWIEKPEIHDFHAGVIRSMISDYYLGLVLEVGCGTGNIALRLQTNIKYIGIDLNPECVKVAAGKNESIRTFATFDIREFKDGGYDLVFTFGFLKHFGLHEWNDIFQKVCSLGEYLVFNMPIAEKTFDDGVEYHHVWLSMDDLRRNIDDNNFELIEVVYHGVEPIFICKRK